MPEIRDIHLGVLELLSESLTFLLTNHSNSLPVVTKEDLSVVPLQSFVFIEFRYSTVTCLTFFSSIFLPPSYLSLTLCWCCNRDTSGRQDSREIKDQRWVFVFISCQLCHLQQVKRRHKPAEHKQQWDKGFNSFGSLTKLEESNPLNFYLLRVGLYLR